MTKLLNSIDINILKVLIEDHLLFGASGFSTGEGEAPPVAIFNDTQAG